MHNKRHKRFLIGDHHYHHEPVVVYFCKSFLIEYHKSSMGYIASPLTFQLVNYWGYQEIICNYEKKNKNRDVIWKNTFLNKNCLIYFTNVRN